MTINTDICKYLDWDSQFFGLNIASTNIDRLDPQTVSQADTWCRENSIDCLYFQANADDNQTIRTAEDHGYRLVEVRMYLENNLRGWDPKTRPQKYPEIHIRPARSEDIPILQSFSTNTFTLTRYYNDDRFPKEKCDELYKIWIKRNCEGHAQLALVAEFDNQVQGYITGFKSPTEPSGQIDLTGVRQGVRRLGLGHAMVHGAFDWYASQGVNYILAVTQATNISTIALAQRNGFITRSCKLYYHKWYS